MRKRYQRFITGAGVKPPPPEETPEQLNSWGYVPGDKTVEEEFKIRPTETLALLIIREEHYKFLALH